MKTHTRILSTLFLLFAGAESLAADKALLIGVSTYPGIDDELPGIDLDLRMMRDTARHLGFASENVKILHDEQATVRGIEDAISTWLVDDIRADAFVTAGVSGMTIANSSPP